MPMLVGKKDEKKCREPGKSPAIIFIQEETGGDEEEDKTRMTWCTVS